MRKRHNKEKKQKHEMKIKTAWGFFLETKIDAGSRVFLPGRKKKITIDRYVYTVQYTEYNAKREKKESRC